MKTRLKLSCSLSCNWVIPVNIEPRSNKPPVEDRKATAVLLPCSHSFPFYLKASGLTSTRPHQTRQLFLQILSGDRKKNPILHRGMIHFFSFFIYYSRHGRNKTYGWSEKEQNFQQCIPGHASWIIYLQQLLWRRLSVYFMSLHMTAKK